MDAEASPSRLISTHLRGALRVARGAWSHATRLALDIALPTLCVACREPVHGDGVCATCWAKLSFIAPPFCPRLGIPFIYDPGFYSRGMNIYWASARVLFSPALIS